MPDPVQPKRVAYYGGSFDPLHRGHLAIAHALSDQFEFDEFVFIPAFHAPHKKRKGPTSAYDRYAMLCLATQNEPKISVSRMEIEVPERPYSVETLSRIVSERPGDDIFFVMGADSWMEITAWREWEKVLRLTNHIVVTRPGIEIGLSHVGPEIAANVLDVRSTLTARAKPLADLWGENAQRREDAKKRVFITDAVNIEVSATDIRRKIREDDASWRDDVPDEVAKYIEKYQIYS